MKSVILIVSVVFFVNGCGEERKHGTYFAECDLDEDCPSRDICHRDWCILDPVYYEDDYNIVCKGSGDCPDKHICIENWCILDPIYYIDDDQDLEDVRVSCVSDLDEDRWVADSPLYFFAMNSCPAGSIPEEGEVFFGDCNDSNAWANPGTEEICDGLDNNCDGEVDESCTVALECDDGNECTVDIAVWDGVSSWCAYEIKPVCD
jgi:hypothetical protein